MYNTMHKQVREEITCLVFSKPVLQDMHNYRVFCGRVDMLLQEIADFTYIALAM
jgi:hypothetical protein